MNNEKYLNCLVDVLKNSLSEHQNANLTLQANIKFFESAMKEQAELVQKYAMMIADYEQGKDKTHESSQIEIENLKKENARLDAIKNEHRDEIQRLKNQVEHLNQLNSSLESIRNENASLKIENEKIKQDLFNAVSAPKQNIKPVAKKVTFQGSVEDGGNF